MKITANIRSSHKILYELELKNTVSGGSQLMSRDILFDNKPDLDGRCRIHSMPGFCVLDESLIPYKAATIDFLVEGEHVLITLFYAGNCTIINQRDSGSMDYIAGTVTKQRRDIAHLTIALSTGEQINRLVFILSAAYISELYKNEAWMHKDPDEGVYFIDSPIRTLLNDLLRNEYTGAYKRPFFELKVKELLFMLHIQQGLSSVKSNLSPEISQKLVMAKAYLISHFVEPPTIRQLSRIVLLNEFKLKQQFKEKFGTTIHAFIVRLKMEKAEKLLLENCSVGDIAAKTGYRSVSHFIETFKKHYGVTPKQAMKGYELPAINR